LLYGDEVNHMATASLELELTTSGGANLNDFVRIELFSLQGSRHYRNNVQATRLVTVRGIEASPFNTYRVMISPSNHRTVQFFQTMADGQTARPARPTRCPADPNRVIGIAAPAHSTLDSRVQSILAQSQIPRFVDASGSFIQGPDLYAALDTSPRLKACLLNIAKKSSATVLRDGKSCLDHYTGMVRMEQDRLFIRTTAALLEEAQNSPIFHQADSSLHDPIPGFAITGSYKTFDRHGNLQLTFQRNTTGGDYVVDVDLDAAQGIEHVFEVLGDAVKGPTDPYDIHEILLADQGLDPGYSLVFPQTAAVIA
jgi:hypothetical protein